MAREQNRLTALQVRNAPPGKYADGGGLWLVKREGGGQWVLRVVVHGQRKEMGLGSINDVSLRDARLDAERWRGTVREGKNPIHERERLRREAARTLNTFRDVALEAFEARKAELKGDGKAGRWFSPLEIHVIPKLGNRPIASIDQNDIADLLRPMWHNRADTAMKAMNRINITFTHAAAKGLPVDMQAPMKARALLGKQRHTPQNIPALPWAEVPAFYQSLTDGSITHLALRLLILTGVRSAPLRHIHEDQIDGDVWTIPGEAMKGRKGKTADFRVPLTAEALNIIAQARRMARDGFLFPSVRKGVISDMTMSRYMERRGTAARPHGFRSSLRDWIADTTSTPHEVAEACLAHVTDGSVVRAYRRTDFLDQRRVVFEAWGVFLSRPARLKEG